jgi:hypothetical protein
MANKVFLNEILGTHYTKVLKKRIRQSVVGTLFANFFSCSKRCLDGYTVMYVFSSQQLRFLYRCWKRYKSNVKEVDRKFLADLQKLTTRFPTGPADRLYPIKAFLIEYIGVKSFGLKQLVFLPDEKMYDDRKYINLFSGGFDTNQYEPKLPATWRKCRDHLVNILGKLKTKMGIGKDEKNWLFYNKAIANGYGFPNDIYYCDAYCADNGINCPFVP